MRTGRCRAEAVETLTLAHSNSLRLLKLVNSLLDFSRIEAGRVEASYEPTDLAAATAELASVFRSAVEQAGLELVVDCEPLAEPAYVDRDMWEKIVLNLLSNAFKFTFEGEIEVALRERGGPHRADAFATPAWAFRRPICRRCSSASTACATRARGRTKAPASASRSCASSSKIHGGEIEVESREGVGTTFTVSMPKGKEHLPAERIGAPRATRVDADRRAAVPRGSAARAARRRQRREPAHERRRARRRAGRGRRARDPARRRQRRHARLRAPLARASLRRRRRRRRAAGARRDRGASPGSRPDRRHDAAPRRLRSAGGDPRRRAHAVAARDHAVRPGRRGGAHRGRWCRCRRLSRSSRSARASCSPASPRISRSRSNAASSSASCATAATNSRR